MFKAWGHFVYRRRWFVLAFSALMLAASIVGLATATTLSSGGPLTTNLEAGRAANLVANELGKGTKQTSTFNLIFQSPTNSWTDPAFKAGVTAALARIQADTRVTRVISPYNAPSPEVARALTSRDGHEALAVVDLKSSAPQSWKDYNALRDMVHPAGLNVTGTGFVAINQAFNTVLEKDLQRAETVTLPVTLILLVLIFASLVAAGLPLGVGVLTILGGVAATFFLNRFTDVSQYALNIVTLIGLGVSIDYSLFVVNRFRDELAGGATRENALARTMATAGRAITFSGVTVAIGLSAMLFFQGTFLASMGAAGAMVVVIAVVYGLTFLPALLAVLGPRVDRLRIPFLHRPREGRGLWHRIATWVMRRPWLVLLPAVGFLLLAASPFLQLRLANGDVDMLPARVEARQGYDRLLTDFPGQSQTTMDVVVNYPDGSPLTARRIGDQYDLARRIAAIPGVLATSSIYDISPNLDRAAYQRMYGSGAAQLPPAVRQAMATSVGSHVVVIEATTNRAPTSDGARDIVKAIRADKGVGDGGQVLVGGQTAIDMDVISYIEQRTPIAVGFVILVTYVVLFLLTGSVVLPAKAVLTNLLSIGASFGALVWLFQQGHLSGLLGFTPQSIDPTIPVILFSIVFGMSMDYEVLLVSRIHEEYLRTGNNTLAVADGLERSGRLITGAAAIMVTVFLAFGLAEVVIIKAIGLGLAIAVALDATVVRALVVPALMRLLGDYNWWAPRFLRRLYHRAHLDDLGPEPAARHERAANVA